MIDYYYTYKRLDNIKDEKVIKITMSKQTKSEGTFQLFYVDKCSDDFISLKTQFTYVGKYYELSNEDRKNVAFGILIPMVPEGVDEEKKGKRNSKLEIQSKDNNSKDNNNDVVDLAGTLEKITVRKSTITTQTTAASSGAQIRTRATKFVTERLTCKLTEGSTTSMWVIEPGSEPDCLEMSAKNPAKAMATQISWPWPGTGPNLAKQNHIAPLGSLDFMGEENLDTGAINIVIRIPQLNPGYDPPVLLLTENGGWQLGKKLSSF